MSVTDEVAIQLTELAEVWQERLNAVSSRVAHMKPAPDRWSISEVVGHLVDSACNNHQRFIRAQTAEVLEFPGYQQNAWVAGVAYREMPWVALICLWAEYNRLLANLIRHIPPDRLSVPCIISSNSPCTLEYLVVDYLKHLEHHLNILDGRIRDGESDRVK